MKAVFVALALALLACGDNSVPETVDPGPTPDGPLTPDTPVAPTNLEPCLDRPTDLPGAPSGQLSCDLLPPGFQVAR